MIYSNRFWCLTVSLVIQDTKLCLRATLPHRTSPLEFWSGMLAPMLVFAIGQNPPDCPTMVGRLISTSPKYRAAPPLVTRAGLMRCFHSTNVWAFLEPHRLHPTPHLPRMYHTLFRTPFSVRGGRGRACPKGRMESACSSSPPARSFAPSEPQKLFNPCHLVPKQFGRPGYPFPPTPLLKLFGRSCNNRQVGDTSKRRKSSFHAAASTSPETSQNVPKIGHRIPHYFFSCFTSRPRETEKKSK